MTTKTKAGDPEVEAEDPEGTGEGHDEGGDEGHGVTLGSLDERIERLEAAVTRFVKGQSGGSRSRQADQSADVAAQVREEVGKIAASEGRRKEREDRIGALEAKVEKIIEKPPREYRPITKILWGEDTDE